jgi:hypothetical protein
MRRTRSRTRAHCFSLVAQEHALLHPLHLQNVQHRLPSAGGDVILINAQGAGNRTIFHVMRVFKARPGEGLTY